MRRCALVAVAALVWAAPLSMARPDDEGPTPAQLATVASGLTPSLVRVEYTAQYDKGEGPGGDRYGRYRYMAMQQFPGATESNDSWDELIKEERPAEHGGFLVSPTRVYTSDPMIHTRFIKSIKVRFGDQVVDATPGAFPKSQGGYFLDLAQPLKGATALKFDAAAKPPYFLATYRRRESAWAVQMTGMRGSVAVGDDGRKVSPNPAGSLVVDKDGHAVSILGVGDVPTDDSWKAAPDQWPAVSAKEMEGLNQKVQAAADSGLLRITLNFRSPRNQGEGEMGGRPGRYGRDDEEDSVTEWNGTGALVDPQTVIVLANLKPKVTARLEKIRVFSADGQEATAHFEGTLQEWGAILAHLDKPAAGPVRFSSVPITDLRDRLLVKAEVTIRGDTRTAYYLRDRLTAFFLSYKGQVFPEETASTGNGRYYRNEAAAQNFLFDLDGALVALPMDRRERVTTDERYGGGGDDEMAVPVAMVADLVKGRQAAFDPENKPLSEEEENRLAWLGTELQSMDPDLARANNVVDQTRNGESGAMVTFIYENSPASKAGIEVGDIILRLHIQGQPKPLEVQVESMGRYGGMMDQMFAAMDQMPEEYLDRLPKPWGSAENMLTRALTDIGFGTPFTADLFRDGKVITKEFKVEQGPASFEAAKRFKSEAAGVTVRDLTYEVRRFFQLKPDDPGVIISKVERGKKSAVAGLKPFELITAVNDAPITSAAEFEKAIAAGGEFRLSVKRMTVGRIVKIKVAAAGSAEAKEGAKEVAPAGEEPAGGAGEGRP